MPLTHSIGSEVSLHEYNIADVLSAVGLVPIPTEAPPHRVAIGRALQPFPRSKRSRHVSAHSAFQLGLSTLEERIRRCRRRGAPASKGRHLPSSLGPFASFLTGLPWRSFTLSWPLPPGVWLLRRLRPPSRTLAFSRPTKVGQTVLEFPSSNAGADSVP